MSSPRRILYVNHEVELGGAERSLLELIAGLDRKRFEPHLACSKEGPLADRGRQHGAVVHYVPMLFRGRARKLFGLFRAGLALRRLVRRQGIDLVHANSLIAGYCASLGARLAHTPCVWHVRDIGYPAPAQRLIAKVDVVLANSNATAASLVNGRDLGDRLQVVYNGVADDFFDQEPAVAEVRQELKVGLDEHLVGIVGRLDPWKGHMQFLDAAKQVLVPCPNTTFLIVGDVLFDRARQEGARQQGAGQQRNTYRAELEQHARKIGIFGKVAFLGQREDVARLLSAMDVVVHPSQAPEPFGRVVAEAHATGRPVVASDLGGIPEIVDSGVSGYLFPPTDTGAMAARIISLLVDPSLGARLGSAGRRRARERFTRAAHAARVQEIYDALIPASDPDPVP